MTIVLDGIKANLRTLSSSQASWSPQAPRRAGLEEDVRVSIVELVRGVVDVWSSADSCL
jgi:hypothetical protein